MKKHRKKWDSLIAEKIRSGMDPSAAARAVNRENPGLEALVVAEHNAHHQANPSHRRVFAEELAALEAAPG